MQTMRGHRQGCNNNGQEVAQRHHMYCSVYMRYLQRLHPAAKKVSIVIVPLYMRNSTCSLPLLKPPSHVELNYPNTAPKNWAR